MSITKINTLRSLINRLAIGDHVEPPGIEDHIDIFEKGIGFNAYYDEVADLWRSCNANANYVIQIVGSDDLSILWSKNNPYGTAITFDPRILIAPDGTVQISGDRGTIINYSSSQSLSINQSGFTITNLGASSDVDFTLPQATSAVIGLHYRFHVRENHLCHIHPYSGDFLRNLGGTSYIDARSLVKGASLRFICMEVGLWEVEAPHGTWNWS